MVGGHTDIALHIANAEPITDNIIFCVIYYMQICTPHKDTTIQYLSCTIAVYVVTEQHHKTAELPNMELHNCQVSKHVIENAILRPLCILAWLYGLFKWGGCC